MKAMPVKFLRRLKIIKETRFIFLSFFFDTFFHVLLLLPIVGETLYIRLLYIHVTTRYHFIISDDKKNEGN